MRNHYAEKTVREAIKSIFPTGTQVSIDGCIIVNLNNNLTNLLCFQDTFDSVHSQNYVKIAPKPIVLVDEPDLPHSGSGKRKSKKPVRLDRQPSDSMEVYDKIGALNLSLKDETQKESHHVNISERKSPCSQINLNFSETMSSTATSEELNSFISPENINTPYRKPVKGKRRIFNRFNRSKSDVNFFPRNFTCNQCKEIYTSLSALGQHTMQTHKYYRCVICSAQFTQRSNLQRHSLKHVGFKPFVCKLCHKAYYRKDHLMRHLEMSHHNADPIESIDVKLTYSECLDYIEQYVLNTNTTPQSNPPGQSDLNKTASSSGSEPVSFKWESPSSDISKVEPGGEKMDVLEISDDFSNHKIKTESP